MPALWWNFPMPWDYRWEGKKKKKTTVITAQHIGKVRLQAMLSEKKKKM